MTNAHTAATAPGGAGTSDTVTPDYDALVIGAGFAGVRMLIELDKLGLSARALEAGTGIGGTWYWNRYPGARTDSVSWAYCFSFSDEVTQEWDWPERYPSHETVRAYLDFLIDKFSLRDKIQLNTRIVRAERDDENNLWTITTATGETLTCTYFITALGTLTEPVLPDIEGLDDFGGQILQSSRWPKEPVDLSDKRVAIIGTGSTGVQMIPELARQAKHLTVFQRTPNYILPSQNHELDDTRRREIKANYPEIWSQTRNHSFGFPMNPANRTYDDVTDEERTAIFEEGWAKGAFYFAFETFDDILVDERSNEAAAEFIRGKIRDIVKDPVTAELLSPKGYPLLAKRPVIGNGYFETYNRDNVLLVDVKSDPIVSLTETGLRTENAEYEFDRLVLATGFDAATGAFTEIDIQGSHGSLADAWKDGPSTVLGVSTPGFPNMLMITGPQAAFANMPVVIEEVVEFIGRILATMQSEGHAQVMATPAGAQKWTEHTAEVVELSLLREGGSVGSWFVGANVKDKPNKPMYYLGGAKAFFEEFHRQVETKFESFDFAGSTQN
ncbi:NAD(P)/FAD-dependent oxidoreductase [Rhodococcus ruber]|uniref:flavin-containing monooxygenase n=1 Tax=Rhodococcus ruber TaxID=1830 RepID=UPI00315DEFF0